MSLTYKKRLKDDVRTALWAFVYFALFMGISLGIIFSIKSADIIKGVVSGLLAGIIFATVMSSYVLIGLLLFNKKWFFYSNMPKQLLTHNVSNVYYESIAGNAAGIRIKYGGLFLTDDSILFVPHRFAIIHTVIEIPFREIRQVKMTGINLLKWFAGGFRSRLLIETVTDKRYEFSVWDIDMWKKKIDERIMH